MAVLYRLLVFVYLCKCIYCYTFTGERKSYIKYKQWDGTIRGSLSFRFKTYKPSGLLLYTDNSRSNGSLKNALMIQLKGGTLYATVQMGADHYKSKKTVYIGEYLNDMQWHKVKLVRYDKETKVMVDDNTNYIINDGDGYELGLDSGVYVGGLPDEVMTERNASVVFKDALKVPRFVGCFDSMLFQHSYEFEDETEDELMRTTQTPKTVVPEVTEVKGVRQGCIDACENITENQGCKNNGKCENRFNTFICNCQGTGFEGRLCMKEAISVQFDGSSYISRQDLKKMGRKWKITLSVRFRTREANGVIFSAKSRYHHIILELYNTTLCLRYTNINLVQNNSFNDGKLHLVEVLINDSNAQVKIDKRYTVSTRTDQYGGLFLRIPPKFVILYTGGHPDSKVLETMNSKSKSNFTGCLQQAHYNGVNLLHQVFQNSELRSAKTYGHIRMGCDVTPVRIIHNQSREGADPCLKKLEAASKTNVKQVLVLSVDHKSGTEGMYFNFNRQSISGLTVYGEMKIDAYNSRTGECGQVVVWGRPNGGSEGDAHGRFNNKPVAPKAGQWRVGDMVVLNNDNCRSAPRTIFHLGILSVDHISGTIGQYFNFMRASIPGLALNGELKFNAINPRTGRYGLVVVWGRTNGGSSGDAHGRFNSTPIPPQPGQWVDGDILIAMM